MCMFVRWCIRWPPWDVEMHIHTHISGCVRHPNRRQDLSKEVIGTIYRVTCIVVWTRGSVNCHTLEGTYPQLDPHSRQLNET